MYSTPPPLPALPERTINNRCILLALGWYTALGGFWGGVYASVLGWMFEVRDPMLITAFIGFIIGIFAGFVLALINGFISILVIHRWFRPLGASARLQTVLPAIHASVTLLTGGFFGETETFWRILIIPILIAAACAWFIGRRIATWYGKAALHLQSNPTAGATTLADYGRVEN